MKAAETWRPLASAVFTNIGMAKSLMAADVFDEYLLMSYPLVFGRGRRMFDDGASATLQLIDCTSTSTGVLIATYRPTG